MADVAGEILIGRSGEDVFDFVADERNELRYNADSADPAELARQAARTARLSRKPLLPPVVDRAIGVTTR